MVFRLPRLPVNWQTQPQLFERYWDDAMNKIENTLESILSLPIIEAALASVNSAVISAQAAADAAALSAAAAQTSGDNTAKETSIVSSYTNPVATISADISGNVTITTHTRVYGDPILNPSVSVTGNTIATGASAGSIVRIYYDDPARAGGAVSYLFTVDPAAVPVQGGDRHSVGVVTIPSAGISDGKVIKPPGYVEP